MKKLLGFNFVEMLMVMLILGIIITLTMPLIRNIKDDDDIFRSYMKKANQDVTDAISLALIKNRYMTGLEMLGKPVITDSEYGLGSYFTCDAYGIMSVFNLALNAKKCNVCASDKTDENCTSAAYIGADDDKNKYCMTAAFKSRNTIDDLEMNTTPGLALGGKSIMLFQFNEGNTGDDNASWDEDTKTCSPDSDGIFGYVYVDMNGNKSPNEMCKDQYRFAIYNDHVAMDGCDFTLE